MRLFKNIKKNKKVQSEDVESNNPNVIFKDLKLQVTIGQWLGVLKSLKTQAMPGFSITTSFDAEELMKTIGVSKNDLVLTADKFAALLKEVVDDVNETYVFSDYNGKDLTFKCHLEKANRDVKMAIRWGSFMDSMPEFIIDTEKDSKTYEYHGEYNGEPAKLTPACYTLKNLNNGNELYRYLSPFSINYTLTSGKYSLSINIDNPEKVSFEGIGSYVYRLAKEQELEQYLLGLSFPTNIFEVYRKVRELDNTTLASHSEFEIKITKKIRKKTNKTTDVVSFTYGKLKNLIKTYNDKTISVSDASWSYETPSLAVTEQDGTIKYNLTLNSEAELKNAKPITDFESVKQEVEQVKVLARTLEKE